MLARKSTELPLDPAAAFAAVEAKIKAIHAERAELAQRKQNAECGLAWRRLSDEERRDARYRFIVETTRKAFGDNVPSDKQLRRMAEEAAEAIEVALPKWQAADLAWREACQKETSRIAKELQPRQRAIAKQIADGLTQLSLGIEADRGLRRELARLAPYPQSAFLPCLEPEVGGNFCDPLSPMSNWRARMRRLGIFDS